MKFIHSILFLTIGFLANNAFAGIPCDFGSDCERYGGNRCVANDHGDFTCHHCTNTFDYCARYTTESYCARMGEINGRTACVDWSSREVCASWGHNEGYCAEIEGTGGGGGSGGNNQPASEETDDLKISIGKDVVIQIKNSDLSREYFEGMAGSTVKELSDSSGVTRRISMIHSATNQTLKLACSKSDEGECGFLLLSFETFQFYLD
jgi:hypothetical protein